MPERRQTAERKTSYERTEWRAVGFDDSPENAWVGDTRHLYEYGEWRPERDRAEEDAAEMLASDPPYEDVWLEVRMVTATSPQRVPLTAALQQELSSKGENE